MTSTTLTPSTSLASVPAVGESMPDAPVVAAPELVRVARTADGWAPFLLAPASATCWLLGCVAPGVLVMDERAGVGPLLTACEALAEYTASVRSGFPVETLRENATVRARRARLSVGESAEQFAYALERAQGRVKLFSRYGSVERMVDALFPAFADAARIARQVPGDEHRLVTEVYRLVVAVICRSLLVAESVGSRPVQIMRVYDRCVRALQVAVSNQAATAVRRA